ncbi:hypothetical protein J3459_004050 [Metarhizium acridum]|nr:hypothetical protein J3459_004050 [Metarhizium acridum]
MKRDQLVEAFLHENKLDVYDVPVQNSPVNGGDGRSADDRMADEFRQRYIEEVAARRLKRRPALTAKQQQQQQQQQQADVLRGPKLGGSRNVRAAARDILLKQKQEREETRESWEAAMNMSWFAVRFEFGYMYFPHGSGTGVGRVWYRYRWICYTNVGDVIKTHV